MPYTLYDPAKPNGAASNGATVLQEMRNNMMALRDAAVMSGGFFGWNCTKSGGTAAQPTTFTYAKGVERVKADVTWGTVGGEAGNPTVVVYSYSANSGTDYSAIGTKTTTYDADSYFTASTWS